MNDAVYVETSAVLACMLGEPDAKKVSRLLNKADVVLSSTLTILEAKRALFRLENQDAITASERSKTLGVLENNLLGWNLLEITFEIQQRAGEKFPVEPVRSLDAIHLVSMLEFLKIYPNLKVLTFDSRIRENLEPLGLELVS